MLPMVLYMDISLKKDKKVILLYPTGNLDLNVSAQFEKILENSVKSHPGLHILLNFKDVDYISSTCLRILVSTERLLKKTNSLLLITNAKTIVRETFSVTNLDSFIHFADSEKEALTAI